MKSATLTTSTTRFSVVFMVTPNKEPRAVAFAGLRNGFTDQDVDAVSEPGCLSALSISGALSRRGQEAFAGSPPARVLSYHLSTDTKKYFCVEHIFIFQCQGFSQNSLDRCRWCRSSVFTCSLKNNDYSRRVRVFSCVFVCVYVQQLFYQAAFLEDSRCFGGFAGALPAICTLIEAYCAVAPRWILSTLLMLSANRDTNVHSDRTEKPPVQAVFLYPRFPFGHPYHLPITFAVIIHD